MNYIFVDGGYFVHYRYFSMCNWWRFARQDEEDIDPFANERFRVKFRETFRRTLGELPSKLKLVPENTKTFIATDCSKGTIWRNDHISNYKGTRQSCDGVRSAFKQVFDKQLLEGFSVISADRLEADDCIAVAIRCIQARESDAKFWVITSDMDYLQLAGNNVQLIDLKFKPLNTWFGDPVKDLFCKIVAGDKSDNIPSVFPRCGIKTAAKYFENRPLFEKKLNEVEGSKERYARNSLIIDFANIPQELTVELTAKLV